MPDEEIRTTKEGLAREDKSHALVKPVTIRIDNEDIEVEPDLMIGWRDILEAEAHNPAKVDVNLPIAGEGSTKFHHAVLSNLRREIAIARVDKKTDRKIFRDLLIRYHPDLYQSSTPETQALAGEYTKALGAMRQMGEIRPEAPPPPRP